MFHRLIAVGFIAIGLVMAPTATWSYDENLAAGYAQLFGSASGVNTGKELHLMKPDVFVEKIRKGERIVTLDIRTPAETAIFTSALPGSLAIPLNDLFRPENLARIPADVPVLVVCQSGMRAAAVGTALRHVGFPKVFILQGGFKALSDYLDAKTANAPLVAGK